MPGEILERQLNGSVVSRSNFLESSRKKDPEKLAQNHLANVRDIPTCLPSLVLATVLGNMRIESLAGVLEHQACFFRSFVGYFEPIRG